jgi:hypothetical protein
MRWAVVTLLSAGTCALAALSTSAKADDAALATFPGAKESIMSYYAANAREGGGNCGAGQMGNISDARVVSESGDQVVLAVNYMFSATSESGTSECSGPAEREFTLGKSGSSWAVTAMSGQTP